MFGSIKRLRGSDPAHRALWQAAPSRPPVFTNNCTTQLRTLYSFI
jgi:hypothetical protein